MNNFPMYWKKATEYKIEPLESFEVLCPSCETFIMDLYLGRDIVFDCPRCGDIYTFRYFKEDDKAKIVIMEPFNE